MCVGVLIILSITIMFCWICVFVRVHDYNRHDIEQDIALILLVGVMVYIRCAPYRSKEVPEASYDLV